MRSEEWGRGDGEQEVITKEQAAAKVGMTLEEFDAWQNSGVGIVSRSPVPRGGLYRDRSGRVQVGPEHHIDDSTLLALEREAEVTSAD